MLLTWSLLLFSSLLFSDLPFHLCSDWKTEVQLSCSLAPWQPGPSPSGLRLLGSLWLRLPKLDASWGLKYYARQHYRVPGRAPTNNSFFFPVCFFFFPLSWTCSSPCWRESAFSHLGLYPWWIFVAYSRYIISPLSYVQNGFPLKFLSQSLSLRRWDSWLNFLRGLRGIVFSAGTSCRLVWSWLKGLLWSQKACKLQNVWLRGSKIRRASAICNTAPQPAACGVWQGCVVGL